MSIQNTPITNTSASASTSPASPEGLFTSALPLPVHVRYINGKARETVGVLYVPVPGKRRAVAQRLPLSRAGEQAALAELVLAPTGSVYTVTKYSADDERDVVLVYRKISVSHWLAA